MMDRREFVKRGMIIIPAYNEERNISRVIRGVRETVGKIEIVVVNDGSTDKTEEKALSLGATVVNHPFNMGVGVALQTGYKYALSNNYNWVVQMDGDGQHNPKDIPRLLEILAEGENDLVLGSRFLGGHNYQIPFMRRLGMSFFAKVVSLISTKKITDTTSGFRAINKKVLNFFTQDQYPTDYPDADVLLSLYFRGFKIREIPVVMEGNIEGKSMHSGIFKQLYYIFKMTLSIFMTIVRNIVDNQ